MGILLALVFRLLFRTHGTGWPLQILVNVVGSARYWRLPGGAGGRRKAVPSGVPS